MVPRQLPQPWELSPLAVCGVSRWTSLGCGLHLLWDSRLAAGQISLALSHLSIAATASLQSSSRVSPHPSFPFLSQRLLSLPNLRYPNVSELFLRFCLGHWLHALGHTSDVLWVTTPHKQWPLSTHCCSNAWNDYIQMICLLCIWQPYSCNVVATAHDPPLVFLKPQAVPKGCPLSDAHQHRKPICNHEARTPLNGWNGWPYRSFPASEALWFYVCIQSTQPKNTICCQQIVGSQGKPQEAGYFLNGTLFFWYLICWKTLPACDGFRDWQMCYIFSCLKNNTQCILKITENNLCEWCKDLKPSSVCALHLHCGELKIPWLSLVFEV